MRDRQRLEDEIADVELPPEKALPRRGLVVVVVVVPAFAQGQQGEPDRVPAGVGGPVADPAEDVGQAVDGKGRVPGEHGADEKAPDQGRPAAEGQEHHREQHPGHRVPTVEPTQLGVFDEVLDEVFRRLVIAVREDPADVGPPETVPLRRVEILGLVAVAVVVPVVAGPPERSLLQRRCADEGEDELKDPARLVRTVGEVPVVACGDGEHPQPVETEAEPHQAPREWDPEHGKRRRVHENEQDRAGTEGEHLAYCHGASLSLIASCVCQGCFTKRQIFVRNRCRQRGTGPRPGRRSSASDPEADTAAAAATDSAVRSFSSSSRGVGVRLWL